MRKMLRAQLDIESGIVPAVVTASGTSAAVDTQDCGSLAFAVHVGATTGNDLGASHKVDIKMLESDDNSTYTDVDGDDMAQNSGNAEDAANNIVKSLDSTADASSVHVVHYRGSKRYVKLNLVETGTVSATLGVLAVKGHLNLKPAP